MSEDSEMSTDPNGAVGGAGSLGAGGGGTHIGAGGGSISLAAVEKLRGRENYSTWAFATKMN